MHKGGSKVVLERDFGLDNHSYDWGEDPLWERNKKEG